MPLYTFFRESNGEYRDVFYAMNDRKDYKGENGNETDWVRVWHKPQAIIDSDINPWSESDFVNKTYNKKDTLGDFQDRSAELSEKRKAKEGKDTVKERYFNERQKVSGGKVSMAEQAEKAKSVPKEILI